VEARRFFKRLGNTAERGKLLEERLEQWRYGGPKEGEWVSEGQGEKHQPFFGLTIVTCEKGDIRQSPDGLFIYGDEGRREIPISRGEYGREAEMREFYNAIMNDRRVFHDGRWGEATLEVCLGILQSAAERREIFMSHQVPVLK
jgi:predicted dehydrogenase